MSTSREVSSGQMLGNCRILEQIGQGGMGTVYRAFQPSLDRVVAVKVISPLLVGDATALTRFRREAQTVASFRHPNILTVYDFGEQDGVTYLVMEFAGGGTLRSRMGTPLSLPDAVALLRPIASALDYAHARGVVHRDVKPANVLIHDDGTLVLSDFGLAHQPTGLQHLTASGLLVGTPAYMAPEQGRSSQVGPSADLYALGVMAYELLTGSVPFSGETPVSIMLAHIQDPLPPARERNPGLPRDVDGVLQQALAKQPENRFATAAALVAALEAARGTAAARSADATIVTSPAIAAQPHANPPADQEPTLAARLPSSQPDGESPSATPPLAAPLPSSPPPSESPSAAPAPSESPSAAPPIHESPASAQALGVSPSAAPAPSAVREAAPAARGGFPAKRVPWPVVAAAAAGVVLLAAVIILLLGTPILSGLQPQPTPIATAAWQVLATTSVDHFNTLAVDRSGFIYMVADDHRLQKLSPNGQPVAGPWGTSGGPIEFDQPRGVALDQVGNLYITEAGSAQRLQQLAPFAPDWLQALSRWGAAGQFSSPSGVAVADDGSIYVADTDNARIQKLSAIGQPLAQWGSLGVRAGQFSAPLGLAVDRQGNVYVADSGNDRIQKLSPDGKPLAQWGSHGVSPGQFSAPSGIAVADDGSVYVADSANARIQKLSPSGQPEALWGSTPGSGPGQFNTPISVAVDAAGALYVLDAGNHRIQKLAAPQT
jgi:serine/threonine-protein kinase